MFGIEDFSKSIVDYSNFDISQLGEAALFGGAILLIGMATIFSVLVVIWLCLVLFKVAFHDLPSKKASPLFHKTPVQAHKCPPAENPQVATLWGSMPHSSAWSRR